jgi:hypothetical protein
MRGPVIEGGSDTDGDAGAVVAPLDASPKLELGEGPKRLGGVPTTLGVGANGLCGGPKMLGGVPTIGAAPVEGVPTPPMELPGVLEMEGAVPIAGAPPGTAEPCPKALAGGANSAADSTGRANVRCHIGSPFLWNKDMQGPFRRRNPLKATPRHAI